MIHLEILSKVEYRSPFEGRLKSNYERGTFAIEKRLWRRYDHVTSFNFNFWNSYRKWGVTEYHWAERWQGSDVLKLVNDRSGNYWISLVHIKVKIRSISMSVRLTRSSFWLISPFKDVKSLLIAIILLLNWSVAFDWVLFYGANELYYYSYYMTHIKRPISSCKSQTKKLKFSEFNLNMIHISRYGSPSMNIDITGALFTLCLSIIYWILNVKRPPVMSMFNEGLSLLRNVNLRLNCQNFQTFIFYFSAGNRPFIWVI